MADARAPLTHRLAAGLRREFGVISFSGATASLAFRTAIAVVLAVLAALWLHLDNPYWAGITALGIIQQDLAASLARSIDRCLGTLAGAVIGYLGAHFVADHLMFQLICAGATIFGIYGQERSKHGYAALLMAGTVILVMFGAMETPDATLHVAVYRALEIMVGVAVACLVDYVFGPTGPALPAARKPGFFTRPIDRGLLVTAVTGGIATALIPVIWEGLQLPGLGQTPITAFVIMIGMRREPAWTALNRLAGCIVGGGFGLLCMRFIGDDPVAWIACLFAGLYVVAHVKHGKGDAAYVGYQAGIALIMAMVQGFAPSPDILPAINRLAGIMGGITVVLVSQPLIAPLVARGLAYLLDWDRLPSNTGDR
ncbi:FUSC family protein [Aquabacter spiritensis]|uniref:Fusaric acid resistance family protein n=1 Tax=Aquabacter spiritensis TaxID=933073 RepID=A0A4R3LVW5_9HYPH|nr:FUSC family protein [Aquabacter spiritensis]TCT02617.1 fusaric acid resistance family protein [Aquabacter spiritensis]